MTSWVPGVTLTAGGSECAKRIMTTRKGQNYDLTELHSGMRAKGETKQE